MFRHMFFQSAFLSAPILKAGGGLCVGTAIGLSLYKPLLQSQANYSESAAATSEGDVAADNIDDDNYDAPIDFRPASTGVKSSVITGFRSVARAWRDTVCVLGCVYDYTSLRFKDLSDPDVESLAWHKAHESSAQRLLNLCFKNGGVYIKLGQHVAALHYLLPMEYVETMKATLDCTPTSGEREVRRIIQEDLGAPPEELFHSFNYTPIASASLAQVHIAITKEGEKVAVKVQHPRLREDSYADMKTTSFFVRNLQKLFPKFDYVWLATEMEINLPRELNFLHEARNAEKCEKLLNKTPHDVAIPTIKWNMSSTRVLTMEFMEGCKINDLAALKKMNLEAKDVAKGIAEVFNHMIFIDGFVHCDPHPGNVLVRPNPQTGKPQLVLLDHGLYSKLSDDFRLLYCRLWNSIVTSDKKGIMEVSAAMNAASLYEMFACVLTASPWEQITSAQFQSMQIDDSNFASYRGLARKYMDDITRLLSSLPRKMILLLKTNDCLRGVDYELGSPNNSDIIRMRYCVRGLHAARLEKDPSLWTWLRIKYEVVAMECRIAAFRALCWAASMWVKLYPAPPLSLSTVDN